MDFHVTKEARLCGIVRSSAGESADVVVARIFDAIDRFAGRAPQFDDITVLVLKKARHFAEVAKPQHRLEPETTLLPPPSQEENDSIQWR